ncbi:MAG: hypothetical protein ACTHW1_11015, partial [Ancrocorticia sp.]
KMDNIQFVTTPFDWAGNRVTPNAQSDVLWDALSADQAFTTSEDEWGNTTITVEEPKSAGSEATGEPTAEASTAPEPTTEAPEPDGTETSEPSTDSTTSSAPVCTKDNAQG